MSEQCQGALGRCEPGPLFKGLCPFHAQPSPQVRVSLTRKHAEQLLELLRAQPQKKWQPVAKKVLWALQENAGAKEYA